MAVPENKTAKLNPFVHKTRKKRHKRKPFFIPQLREGRRRHGGKTALSE